MIDNNESNAYQATTSPNSQQQEKAWYKKRIVRFPNALQTPDKTVINFFFFN